MIKSLNLEIINICNLRCKMCDIWTNKEKNILIIDDLKNLFKSKYIDKNIDITITWWEPFLHEWINNLIQKIYKIWFKVSTISTNWILYEKIYSLLIILRNENIAFPNIHISIDWDEKIHDAQRWIKWSFKKSIETIIKLKKEFEMLNFKLKYTITKSNIESMDFAYNLSKKLWIEISFKIVENDENYTNTKVKPELLNDLEKNIIWIKLLKIYWDNSNSYIKNLLYYLKNNKLNFKCKTPEENLFIMASWEVFPCTKYASIWNLKETNIDEILFNNIHKEIIKKVDENNCSKCFSLHWAYKSIIKLWTI